MPVRQVVAMQAPLVPLAVAAEHDAPDEVSRALWARLLPTSELGLEV